MLIRKAYKYKLKYSHDREQQLLSAAGCCRVVWNKALALNLYRLENKLPLMWYHELAYWLTFWKKTEDLAFLKDCPSQALQQTLKNLDKAFKDGFDKKQPLKRIPTFKKRGQHDSFRYPQKFKFKPGHIFLPKIGWVKYFDSRKIQGLPKNVTVSRRARDWYVSIQVELDIEPSSTASSITGGDVGIVNLLTLSNGKVYAPVNSYRKYQTKLANAQRQLKNKTKFSNNWRKQQQKIARLHVKITDIRHDRVHWISNQISKNHAILVLEDLKISNMSKSAKGTIEQPGRHVKAKSGLNKAILDQGWGYFKQFVEYKMLWNGGQVLYVDPKHTSQTCPSCQHVSRDNRQTQSDFECVECGFKNNADIVGAINILARGHRVLACGETGQ